MEIINSAGIIPVVKKDDGYQYLLLKRGEYYDFPKGKLDPWESHMEAAIRELKEEANLSDIEFRWGSSFYETEPYQTKNNKKKRRKVARYYVAYLLSGQAEIIPNPETGFKEHDELQWVSYEQAAQLQLHDRIRQALMWADGVVDPKPKSV